MFEGLSCTTPLQLIQMVAGLATVGIAAIVAFVTFQQWKTNQATLREKLFERRFLIFKQTQSYLSDIQTSGRFVEDNLAPFTDVCQRSRFLYGRSIQTYLLEIRSRSITARKYFEIYKDQPVGEERSRLVNLEHVEIIWLTDQLPKIFDIFEPYLGFSKFK